MEYLRIPMIAILLLLVAMILKQWKSDFLPLLRMGGAILIGTLLFSSLTPLLRFLGELTESAGVTKYASYIFKALGIAFLTQCASDLCRETGEAGIASWVDLAGRSEILLLSLPLIREILESARKLLEVGV